jgi:hypothetical protein
MPVAACRSINPALLECVRASGIPQSRLALIAGFPHYTQFYEALRADRLRGTPLLVERLERLADAIGFPCDEIFLDHAEAVQS